MLQIRVEACGVLAPSPGKALDGERSDGRVFAWVRGQDNRSAGGFLPSEVRCNWHLELLTQRRGNVLRHVNQSYDQHLVVLFKVEQPVRELAEQPKAQAWYVQIYGVAW